MSELDDHITTSGGKQSKTSAHTLIRVRNNQRRHRQRRREYIASLEQRLEETQALLGQAEAKVVRLQAELDTWKDLDIAAQGPFEEAECLGSTRGNVDGPALLPLIQPQSHQAEEQTDATLDGDAEVLHMTSRLGNDSDISLAATTVTQGRIYPVISTSSPSNVVGLAGLSIFSSLLPSSILANAHTESSPNQPARESPRPQCCLLAQGPSTTIQTDTLLPPSPIFVSQELTLPPDPCCNTYPPSNEKESTTLCSQAYVLIAQQNFRGLSATTIKTWLDQGFRRGRRGDEGCRVENGLLFGLLDFISGGYEGF